MCCGQKREALRNSGAPETAATGTNAGAKPAEGYYLRNVPVRLRAALTGRPADLAQRPPRTGR